jgi:hypothetical protein
VRGVRIRRHFWCHQGCIARSLAKSAKDEGPSRRPRVKPARTGGPERSGIHPKTIVEAMGHGPHGRVKATLPKKDVATQTR